jgi:2-phosphoglycerate kinase
VSISTPWRVLLIGGSSGVGKTTVSRIVAEQSRATLAQADDFRLVLQRTTAAPPLAAPPDRSASPAARRDAWIDAARFVSTALQIVVAFHVATDAPIVLEGDTILPELAACRRPGGVPVAAHVHGAILAAESEAVLWRNARARGRGFDALSPADQRAEIRRNWLYSEWLVCEAARFGVPVVPVGGADTAIAVAARVAAAARPALS